MFARLQMIKRSLDPLASEHSLRNVSTVNLFRDFRPSANQANFAHQIIHDLRVQECQNSKRKTRICIVKRDEESEKRMKMTRMRAE